VRAISRNFSNSLGVKYLSGTLRRIVIMLALIGITGASLGAGVVGSYVGDLDDVGSLVGDSVGYMGAGVKGAPVTGAAVVGVNVGGSVSGDLVGAGRVGLPVGTRGHGSSITGPYMLKGLQGIIS